MVLSAFFVQVLYELWKTVYMVTFNSCNNLQDRYYCPHFSSEEADTPVRLSNIYAQL